MADEPNSTTPAPGGETQTTPTPAPAPAATSGTEPGTQVPEGFVPRTELDKVEAARRETQSKLDRLQATVQKPEPPAAPAGPADTAGVIAAFETRMELREARLAAQANEAFKGADPSILNRATSFDSVESFYAALEQSATERKSAREAMKAELDAEIRAEYLAKFPDLAGALGANAAPPVDNGQSQPAGAMTIEALAAMPLDQADAWITKNPDAYQALLAGTR